MRSTILVIVASLPMLAAATAAFTSTGNGDREAIKTAALDYANGWYTGDRERMGRSLHDAMVKRAYLPDAQGRRALSLMDKASLLVGNRPGNADHYRDAPKRAEVEILDVYGGAASVRLHMDGWVDYLHVVRGEGGDWRIINVLWELEPTP